MQTGGGNEERTEKGTEERTEKGTEERTEEQTEEQTEERTEERRGKPGVPAFRRSGEKFVEKNLSRDISEKMYIFVPCFIGVIPSFRKLQRC